MDSAPHPSEERIPLWAALIPVVSLITFLALFILILPKRFPDFEGTGHLPLVFASAVAALVASAYGYKWKTLKEGILKAINVAMGAILILLVIGCLMGTWLASGIVPAFIDWGLRLMSPSYFLPATCAVCSIVSLVSGSSWSTAGTIGLALIGVGSAMGIPNAWTAGAVISGAYFGDKLSPLSDTTNLAPAMAGAELFDHVRHMLWTTTPAWIVAMVIYTFMGLRIDTVASTQEIAAVHEVLVDNFRPSLIHLSVPIVVGVLVIKKVPALPALVLGAALGGVLGVARGAGLDVMLQAAMDGFAPATGNEAVDELLARGGMTSMSGTVLLILCAMVFGGVMERSGMLRVLASSLLSAAKSTGSLIASTVLTATAVNLLAADQYISVVVPGRMYAPEYEARGLHPKNLSRALEDGGTITSPLIPWNTCGAFMSTTLGVATGAYLPFAFLNLLNPIIGMIYGFTGFTIEPAEAPSSVPKTDA